MGLLLRRNDLPFSTFCRRCGQVRRFVTLFGLCQRCLANGLLRRYKATCKARCQETDRKTS